MQARVLVELLSTGRPSDRQDYPMRGLVVESTRTLLEFVGLDTSTGVFTAHAPVCRRTVFGVTDIVWPARVAWDLSG